MKPSTTPLNKLHRALWLAFQASSPMGMGFLHAASAAAQTEQTLAQDYSPRQLPDGSQEIYVDYAFGRMMKTMFALHQDGSIEVKPEIPRNDYQSWGAFYPTATALLADVEKTLNEEAKA